MKKLIACCGINCESCDAYIATVNNDNELREKTAQQWREAYNAPHIVAESINCMGCCSDDVKFDYCNHCNIRNCAIVKEFTNCGECDQLESCQELNFVLQQVPGAKENLLG